MTTLPVLDIGSFRRAPSSGDGRRFVSDLRAACHEIGFAYIVGHGVDVELDDALLADAARFFALPEKVRRSLAIENSPAFRGYTMLGDERTNGRCDWRDQLDVGPEQSAPDVSDDGPAWLRLRGPNQWPAALPSMQSSVLGWMSAMEALGLDALRALAVGLGQPIDHFDDGFLPESDVHLKVIRYPGTDSAAGDIQGVGTHHDSGLLTFILQDETGGLEVLVGDEFVDAPPLDGAYIMNLGEMMQRATSGFLRATPHRVRSPASDAQRISVAFFFNPRFETVVHPIELPAELAAVPLAEAERSSDDRIHAVFGENNLKIRLRSHPDVAARHYADVDYPT